MVVSDEAGQDLHEDRQPGRGSSPTSSLPTPPLEGRYLFEDHTQAPIAEDIAYWRTCAQCSDTSEIITDGPLTCEVWSDCAAGGPVRFCLHDGGHGQRTGWAARQLDWLTTL